MAESERQVGSLERMLVKGETAPVIIGVQYAGRPHAAAGGDRTVGEVNEMPRAGHPRLRNATESQVVNR